MSNVDRDLTRLGDELERVAGHSLHRRRRIRVTAMAVAALVLVGGTAAATGLFTPREVAAGMPAGTAIFGQTDPTCVLDHDGITYHCTLASDPAPEPGPAAHNGRKPGLIVDGPVDHRGSKEIVVVDGKVAGGCIGQDRAGRRWDCFMGEHAVRHAIITQDFLGEPVFGPGVG